MKENYFLKSLIALIIVVLGSQLLSAQTDVTTYQSGNYKTRSVIFSEDSKFLAVKSGDQPVLNKGILVSPSITIWDMETGKIAMNLIDKELIRASAFSQDGRFLAVRERNNINILEIKSQRVVSVIKFSDKKTDFARPIAFTSDNKSIIIENGTQSSLYSVETGQYERDFYTKGLNPSKSSDDRYMVKAFVDNFCLYDFETAKEIHTFYCGNADKKAQEELKSVFFSPNNRFALTLSNNKVRFWDLVTYKVVQNFDLTTTDMLYGFSPDSRYIMGGNDTLKLWDIATGRQINTPVMSGSKDFPITAASFSPDGKYLSAGDARGQVNLWYFSYDNVSSAYYEKQIRAELKDLAPKGEFEKTNEYNARFQKQSKLIREKYLEKYMEEVVNVPAYLDQIDAQVAVEQEQHKRRVAESLSVVSFKVESVSAYNADKENFTIKITNEIERYSQQLTIKVPRRDNPACFKQNYKDLVIYGVKQLTDDEKSYDFFNVKIKSSCPGKEVEYPFGPQKRPLYVD
jgi:WD domain, G-beta repeat